MDHNNRIPTFGVTLLMEKNVPEAALEFIKILLDEVSANAGLELQEYDFGQIIKGMRVELEHGTQYGEDTNVTGNDILATLKIALAHLKEDPKYYDKLEIVEGEDE